MTTEKKPRISKKWMIVLAIVLILTCVGGLALLSRWYPLNPFQAGTGTEVPIPLQGGDSSQGGDTTSSEGGETKMENCPRQIGRAHV